MSQVISLVILPSKICSGTLEDSLSRSLWRSSLGRNSHLSQTGLKSKETIFRRITFLYTHFQLPDFEEHPDNCIPDLLDWRQRASPGWKEWRVTQGNFILILTGHLRSCIPFDWWELSSSFYDRLWPGRAMWGLRNTTQERSLLFTHSDLKKFPL